MFSSSGIIFIVVNASIVHLLFSQVFNEDDYCGEPPKGMKY